mmetsp:Transcript_159133/g.296548  ORF Transcript_159133/g.296548 Transcript_159133/m.296548 type:complete len:718 (-) Transcript_159133:58-2211(-)
MQGTDSLESATTHISVHKKAMCPGEASIAAPAPASATKLRRRLRPVTDFSPTPRALDSVSTTSAPGGRPEARQAADAREAPTTLQARMVARGTLQAAPAREVELPATSAAAPAREVELPATSAAGVVSFLSLCAEKQAAAQQQEANEQRQGRARTFLEGLGGQRQELASSDRGGQQATQPGRLLIADAGWEPKRRRTSCSSTSGVPIRASDQASGCSLLGRDSAESQQSNQWRLPLRARVSNLQDDVDRQGTQLERRPTQGDSHQLTAPHGASDQGAPKRYDGNWRSTTSDGQRSAPPPCQFESLRPPAYDPFELPRPWHESMRQSTIPCASNLDMPRPSTGWLGPSQCRQRLESNDSLDSVNSVAETVRQSSPEPAAETSREEKRLPRTSSQEAVVPLYARRAGGQDAKDARYRMASMLERVRAREALAAHDCKPAAEDALRHAQLASSCPAKVSTVVQPIVTTKGRDEVHEALWTSKAIDVGDSPRRHRVIDVQDSPNDTRRAFSEDALRSTNGNQELPRAASCESMEVVAPARRRPRISRLGAAQARSRRPRLGAALAEGEGEALGFVPAPGGSFRELALVVKKPWVDLILAGHKTWEIRGTSTHRRCTICLAQSGSGKLVGEVRIIDCVPLRLEDLPQHVEKHCIQDFTIVKYRRIYAWVLQDAVRYEEPLSYTHPQGAITWVKLNTSASEMKPVPGGQEGNADVPACCTRSM